MSTEVLPQLSPYISPNPILQASGLQEKDKTWLRLYLALLKGSRSPYPFLISRYTCFQFF